jgi:hypothetical protein
LVRCVCHAGLSGGNAAVGDDVLRSRSGRIPRGILANDRLCAADHRTLSASLPWPQEMEGAYDARHVRASLAAWRGQRTNLTACISMERRVRAPRGSQNSRFWDGNLLCLSYGPRSRQAGYKCRRVPPDRARGSNCPRCRSDILQRSLVELVLACRCRIADRDGVDHDSIIPGCKIACNIDPLRGGFRVQYRPL